MGRKTSSFQTKHTLTNKCRMRCSNNQEIRATQNKRTFWPVVSLYWKQIACSILNKDTHTKSSTSEFRPKRSISSWLVQTDRWSMSDCWKISRVLDHVPIPVSSHLGLTYVSIPVSSHLWITSVRPNETAKGLPIDSNKNVSHYNKINVDACKLSAMNLYLDYFCLPIKCSHIRPKPLNLQLIYSY